ncbi:MAG: hypothetical protein ACP5RE_02830 [Candidatus Acidifodinimicrobium sp.]
MNIKEGQLFPDFTLMSDDGSDVSLSGTQILKCAKSTSTSHLRP